MALHPRLSLRVLCVGVFCVGLVFTLIGLEYA